MKELYYDLDPSEPAPKVDEYLVSIGQRGVGTVWHIAAVRMVRHKTIVTHQRYILKLVAAPDMKPLTVVEGDKHGCTVWVRGEKAHPLVWYPRDKKSE